MKTEADAGGYEIRRIPGYADFAIGTRGAVEESFNYWKYRSIPAGCLASLMVAGHIADEKAFLKAFHYLQLAGVEVVGFNPLAVRLAEGVSI